MNILFLIHGGTNSRDIFMDMLEGTREAGHQTIVLGIEPLFQIYGRIPDRQTDFQGDICRLLAQVIRENKIDLTIAMWANALQLLGLTQINGQTVTFFDAVNSPLLNFWLDAPERAHCGSLISYFRTSAFTSPQLFHLINNEATAEEMSRIFGFSNVLPIPYGVNPKVFQPHEVPKEYDIAFSAGGGEGWITPTPVMLEEVRKDEPNLRRVREDLAQQARQKLDAIAKLFDAAMQASVRESLEQLLQLQLDQPTMTMFHRLNMIAGRSGELRKAVEALGANLKAYVDAAQVVRGIEGFRRIFYFVYLARYFKCAMYGKADLSAWDCHVPSEGFVAYDQQSRQYAKARLGLSVMRWQDEVGLHIKPFEITASGTACLAEHRIGIEQLWTSDKEIVTFRTLPEAREKIVGLLANPQQLQDIAAAGRQRTLRDHTWARRMTVIPEVIKKLRRQYG